MSNQKAYFMCSEGQAVCLLGPARISLLALNTCKSVNPRSVLPPFTLLHVESDPRGPGGSYPPAASDWPLATCRHVDLFRSADLSCCLQRRRKTQPSCCWLSWPIQPWMNVFISKLFTFRKKKEATWLVPLGQRGWMDWLGANSFLAMMSWSWLSNSHFIGLDSDLWHHLSNLMSNLFSKSSWETWQCRGCRHALNPGDEPVGDGVQPPPTSRENTEQMSSRRQPTVCLLVSCRKHERV